MERIIRNFGIYLGLILCLSSCKENIFTPEVFKSGIYFKTDSTDYSFGITPLGVNEYHLNIPVSIMGAKVNYEREYSVRILDVKTNAELGKHFNLPNTLTIPADSVNGQLQLTLLREELGNADFKIAIQLDESADFIPVNENLKSTVITFNNRVEQPNWLNWQGRKAWPSSKLGQWNPHTYIKFMELFGEMKEVVPNTYWSIANTYGGELLPNFDGGWAWDYDFSLSKYVLIPLYKYFMEEHTDLGVRIPRPSGY